MTAYFVYQHCSNCYSPCKISLLTSCFSSEYLLVKMQRLLWRAGNATASLSDRGFCTKLMKRKRLEGIDRPDVKAYLGTLKERTSSVGIYKAYQPPTDVAQQVLNAARECGVTVADDWGATPIVDRTTQFRLMSRLVTLFNHDIPNNQLSKLTTLAHLVQYFEQPVAQSAPLDTLPSADLPKNLHVQVNYDRFADDAGKQLHSGVTAFPGRHTKIASLKFRRKYAGYKAEEIHKFLDEE